MNSELSVASILLQATILKVQPSIEFSRCETLGSGVPIESALELTIRALEIVAHLHAQSKDIWHGHLDLDNIYLSDDGTLSLGWDGIRIAENPADRDWGQPS